MASTKKAPKIKMVCEDCGSENVMIDAWAVWDVDLQEWVLGPTFDHSHCDDCEGDAHIAEVPIKARRKRRS